MGNEHSASTELTVNGKISEKHENGSVNGTSANIKINGLATHGKSEIVVHQNGESHTLNLTTESSEFEIVESVSQPASAPVVSEIPDAAAAQKEEAKKGKEEKVNLFGKVFKKKAESAAHVESEKEKEKEKENKSEDQPDVSLPPNDPHQDPRGEEATTVVVIEHREGSPKRKVDTSTQTDQKHETDISTQTGDDATNTDSLTAETEDASLNDSTVIIAEEVVEDTLRDDFSDDQAVGIIIEEVVGVGNDVYENIVFRAERVEVTDIFVLVETEPQMAAEPQCINTVVEEPVPLEITYDLPKVVADCVEAVFAADSETADYTAAVTSEPERDEVITEDYSEGAGDVSADVALNETNQRVAREADDIPSVEKESFTTVTISAIVHEEQSPTPGNLETDVPCETETLLKVESAYVEVTAAADAAVEVIPEISKQENLNPVAANDPSEAESTIVVAPFAFITIEELVEDTFDDEVKPEPVPEVVTTNEIADVGEDVIPEVGPETTEESAAIVKDNAVEIPDAAIDALSQQFEATDATHQELATDNISFLEEVIIATVFVPLAGELEPNPSLPEEHLETSTEETNQQAIEILANEIATAPDSTEEVIYTQESSTEGVTTAKKDFPEISEEPTEEIPNLCEGHPANELLENLLKSVAEAFSEKHEANVEDAEEPEADMPPMEPIEKSEPCVPVQEELIVENAASAEGVSEDADKETDPSLTGVQVVESLDPAEEPAEESEQQPKTEMLVVILEESEDEVTEEIMCETNNPGDVFAANFHTDTFVVAEDDEDDLEAIVEEIIREEAQCDIASSDEAAAEMIAEMEENESSADAADSAVDSLSVAVTEGDSGTSSNIDVLITRLMSACTSVVEESAYLLGDLEISSLGYNITVTIHVTPKEEQQ